MKKRTKLSRIFGRFSSVLAERRHLGSTRTVALRFYDEALLRLHFRLPFRGYLVTVKIPAELQPLRVRLGTSDFCTIGEVFGEQEYLPAVELLDPAGTHLIIDLGGNAGFSTRFWLSRFPACHVIALEPDPANADMFAANIRLSGAESRVTLHRACAVAKAGEFLLTQGCAQNGYSLTDQAEGAIRVAGITMATLLEKIARVDLLKCDIEGGERGLFKDASTWIAKAHAVAVELHPPYCLDEMLADLSAAGAGLELIHHRKLNASGLTMAYFIRK